MGQRDCEQRPSRKLVFRAPLVRSEAIPQSSASTTAAEEESEEKGSGGFGGEEMEERVDECGGTRTFFFFLSAGLLLSRRAGPCSPPPLAQAIEPSNWPIGGRLLNSVQSLHSWRCCRDTKAPRRALAEPLKPLTWNLSSWAIDQLESGGWTRRVGYDQRSGFYGTPSCRIEVRWDLLRTLSCVLWRVCLVAGCHGINCNKDKAIACGCCVDHLGL